MVGGGIRPTIARLAGVACTGMAGGDVFFLPSCHAAGGAAITGLGRRNGPTWPQMFRALIASLEFIGRQSLELRRNKLAKLRIILYKPR